LAQQSPFSSPFLTRERHSPSEASSCIAAMHHQTDDKTSRNSKSVEYHDRLPLSRSRPPKFLEKRERNLPNDRRTYPPSKRLCLEGTVASSSSAPSPQLVRHKRQSQPCEEVTVQYILSRVLENIEERKTK